MKLIKLTESKISYKSKMCLTMYPGCPGGPGGPGGPGCEII